MSTGSSYKVMKTAMPPQVLAALTIKEVKTISRRPLRVAGVLRLRIVEKNNRFDHTSVGSRRCVDARQSAASVRLPHVMAPFRRGNRPAHRQNRRAAPLTPSLANKRGRQNGVPLRITLKIGENELQEPPRDE